jgi:hypothetical protein
MKRSPASDNEFMGGFFKWLESDKGQNSIEALDYVFEALKGVDLDVSEKKIICADGQKLTIDQSAEKIHQRTGMNIEKIRSHIVGWLQMEYEPKGLDDRKMQLFESQIDAWVEDYENSSNE